jgi:hypothetical protein
MLVPQSESPNLSPTQYNWQNHSFYILMLIFYIRQEEKVAVPNVRNHSRNLMCPWFHQECHSDLLDGV